MQGAGEITDTQPMTENSDVRCFTHKGALVAFADMDVPHLLSGAFNSKSRRISKRGSFHLRSALFQMASVILQHSEFLLSFFILGLDTYWKVCRYHIVGHFLCSNNVASSSADSLIPRLNHVSIHPYKKNAT